MARFVAYYDVNNELVVDSTIMEVQEELPNQVSLYFALRVQSEQDLNFEKSFMDPSKVLSSLRAFLFIRTKMLTELFETGLVLHRH